MTEKFNAYADAPEEVAGASTQYHVTYYAKGDDDMDDRRGVVVRAASAEAAVEKVHAMYPGCTTTEVDRYDPEIH